MDFEKRRLVIPPGTVTRIYSDQIRVTEKIITFAASDETVILADASSGEIKVSLPAANTIHGKWYWVKKIDSSANAVVVDADGSEVIDGEQTVTLRLQYQYIVIVSDGTEWFIVGGEYVKMEELLTEQLDKQEEIIAALKNIETHLALGSDEELDEEGGD